jgi:hypothetical protein
MDMRRTHYRDLAKTPLQHVATATAVNVQRVIDEPAEKSHREDTKSTKILHKAKHGRATAVSQRMKQPRPRHRRLTAARRPGNDNEVGHRHPLEQVFRHAFAAEEEWGVAFLEGGEADLGDTAVPHSRLVHPF